jgi:hypothetical protein
MPKKPLKISPFDILYGWPLLIPGLLPSPPATLPSPLLQLLLSPLRAALWAHSDFHLPQPLPSTKTPSSIKTGDSFYLTTPHSSTSLKPKWMGPHKVILATPTAPKLKGYPAWVHISRLNYNPLIHIAPLLQFSPPWRSLGFCTSWNMKKPLTNVLYSPIYTILNQP